MELRFKMVPALASFDITYSSLRDIVGFGYPCGASAKRQLQPYISDIGLCQFSLRIARTIQREIGVGLIASLGHYRQLLATFRTSFKSGFKARFNCMGHVFSARTPLKIVRLIVYLDAVKMVNLLSRTWLSIKGSAYKCMDAVLFVDFVSVKAHVKVARLLMENWRKDCALNGSFASGDATDATQRGDIVEAFISGDGRPKLRRHGVLSVHQMWANGAKI